MGSMNTKGTYHAYTAKSGYMKIPLCTFVLMYLWNLFITKHAVDLHMIEVGKQPHKARQI